MPTRLTTNYLRLKDEDEFETLVRDICALEWDDPDTQKFGRKGQNQWGVDVYGQPSDGKGFYRAAQCKLRTTGARLSKKEVRAEVTSAQSFPHRLDKLILVTDGPRDTETQILVDKLSELSLRANSFRVVIWFWDDITERLALYPHLLVSYYPDHIASLTNAPFANQLVDVPLTVLFLIADNLTPPSALEEYLQYCGVRVLRQVAKSTSAASSSLIKADGVFAQFAAEAVGASSVLPPERFAYSICPWLEQLDPRCPAWIFVPPEVADQVRQVFQQFLTSRLAVDLIPTNGVPAIEYRTVFEQVFRYGYERRGSLPTVNVAIRTAPTTPSSTLLDADWHSRLDVAHHPTPDQWDAVFVPALSAMSQELIALRQGTRVQVEAKAPIPAAIAIGYWLNIRLVRLGVWARRQGASDSIYQYWRSDGESASIAIAPTWILSPVSPVTSAVVELSTYETIHPAVAEYVSRAGIPAGGWSLVSLDSGAGKIEEGLALAYANAVAQHVRKLTALGVTDTHLFARIPAALGVLIGQRLQACGRIHLYWYENPTYRFAFTLQ